jgi:hypothetical protein
MPTLRRRVEFWGQVTGLLATAWLVWAISLSSYGRGRLLARIGMALWIACCALAWSAVIAGMVQLVRRRLRGWEDHPAIRISAAVWFAPATILLLQFSLPGLSAGLALIVIAARLLSGPSGAEEIWYEEQPVFLVSRHFIPVLGISTGFQLAAVAFWMGRPIMAAALFGMCVAMLTATAIGLGAWGDDKQPNLPRSVLGLVLTFLLALTAGGGGGWGFGFGSGNGIGGDQIAALPGRSAKKPETSSPTAATAPGNYPGVILWPEIKPLTTLIAPMPTKGSGFGQQARPLTIPFGGEYWMFRWPYYRPPPNSYFQRGTPWALSFSTPDHFPMQMEARQKLPQAISLRCCSHMQLAVLNADPSPQTISLELILIDDQLPNTSLQSLGRAAVTSVPEKKAAVPEVLDFLFPTAPRFDQFDEIKVIFHRTAGRMDRSARVSIERFVLVPL